MKLVKKSRLGIWLAWITLSIAAGASEGAAAADPARNAEGIGSDEVPVELEALVVIGSPNPMDASAHRLRILVSQSSPRPGFEALAVGPRQSFATRLITYARAPASLPELDQLERMAMDLRLMNHPELDEFR